MQRRPCCVAAADATDLTLDLRSRAAKRGLTVRTELRKATIEVVQSQPVGTDHLLGERNEMPMVGEHDHLRPSGKVDQRGEDALRPGVVGLEEHVVEEHGDRTG